jgi:uncharacterized protein (TIGR02271 family)
MTESSADRIVDLDGHQGRIIRSFQKKNDQGTLILLEMMDGRRLWAPQEWLEELDGEYFLPYRTAHLPTASLEDDGGSLVIPVLVETVDVKRRRRITGAVRVTKRVQTEDNVVELRRAKETVEVERVPINREVSEPPPVRQEGDVTIVPILEEVLVVEKRLVLREELRIIRRRRETSEQYRVPLRREVADIEQLPAEKLSDDAVSPERPERNADQDDSS